MNNRFAAHPCGASIPEESILSHSRLKSIVAFILGGQPFGIDINLVHSFIPAGPYTPARDIHPGLSGFFRWTAEPGAGSAIPLLNIAHLLGKNELQSAGTVMICEWHHSLLAFSVDRIAGIYDLSLHELSSAGPLKSVPGLLNGADVLLPDFQTLTYGVIQALSQKQVAARQQKSILLVHNSALLREVLTTALRASGYTKLTELDSYDQAYPYLLAQYKAGRLSDLLITGSTGQPPLSDLQSLIRTIKAGLRFRSLPAILLTDRYDLAQYPDINAQINPFNLSGLIEQSDALTGTLTIGALNETAMFHAMTNPCTD